MIAWVLRKKKMKKKPKQREICHSKIKRNSTHVINFMQVLHTADKFVIGSDVC